MTRVDLSEPTHAVNLRPTKRRSVGRLAHKSRQGRKIPHQSPLSRFRYAIPGEREGHVSQAIHFPSQSCGPLLRVRYPMMMMLLITTTIRTATLTLTWRRLINSSGMISIQIGTLTLRLSAVERATNLFVSYAARRDEGKST